LWEEPLEDSWEVPLTPRYAAEEPSPGRMVEPEVPPTPRYEGEWFGNEDWDSD